MVKRSSFSKPEFTLFYFILFIYLFIYFYTGCNSYPNPSQGNYFRPQHPTFHSSSSSTVSLSFSSFSILAIKSTRLFNCSFLVLRSLTLTLAKHSPAERSPMRPVSASSSLDPADACPTRKSSFTSFPGDPSTTLSPWVDSDSTSSGGSSLEVGEKPVTLSILSRNAFIHCSVSCYDTALHQWYVRLVV